MPNLVHSLDAATMLLLYYSLRSGNKNNYVNFYSVHDCFGVTADNVDLLITLIKKIYIEIYSDNKYIQDFDDDIVKHIRIHFGYDKTDYIEDKRMIIIEKDEKIEHIQLPELPKNKLDLKSIKKFYKKLEKARFLIS